MRDLPYKIAFFGSDEIALPCLDYLHEEFPQVEIRAVLTQPDRRVGRGRKMAQNAIKKWAQSKSIPCRSPEKPSSEECDWLREEKIDCILVMAYGHILRKSFLEVAPAGCYNLHASLLPSYRGASPIETAIAMGETSTGVTLMKVVPRMDAGPIVDSEAVSICPEDTGLILRSKIAQACVPLIKRKVECLVDGSVEYLSQDDSLSTYCRKLTKEDGQLDFSAPSKLLVDRIRAFQAWPGCSFPLGGQKIRIGSAESKDGEISLAVGETAVDSEGNFFIGTGNGLLLLKELQRPGGKMLKTADFLRGFDFPFGQVIDSSPMNELLLPAKE